MQQARSEAEGMQARRVLWQIYAMLDEMEYERGNREQANAHHERARDVLKFIAAHIPPDPAPSFATSLLESLLNLPRVRAVIEGAPSG